MKNSTFARIAFVGRLAGFLVVVFGLGRFANATIVTLAPTNVNALEALNATTVKLNGTQNFSTFMHTNGNLQEPIVGTTTADFLAALTATLGPAPGYIINSAKLIVGSPADNYKPQNTVNAYLLSVAYTPSQTTWNNRATGTPWGGAGLLAGTDYVNTSVSTPTANPTNPTTVSDFLGFGAIVQNWINNPSSNVGIVFKGTVPATDGTLNLTVRTNVMWELDAVAVPEPSAIGLLFIAGFGLLAFGRRSAMKTRQLNFASCTR